MTNQEKAQALLSLVDKVSFQGNQRHMLMEIAEWLESIAGGSLLVIPNKSENTGITKDAGV